MSVCPPSDDSERPWLDIDVLRTRWGAVIDAVTADGDDRRVLHRSVPLEVHGPEVVVGLTPLGVIWLTDRQQQAFTTRLQWLIGSRACLRFVPAPSE